MKLSAKWLNKFHINVIVVFPENIHTPSTEGNGNLIECWGGGGGGGGVKKAKIILRYCGWAFWTEIV